MSDSRQRKEASAAAFHLLGALGFWLTSGGDIYRPLTVETALALVLGADDADSLAVALGFADSADEVEDIGAVMRPREAAELLLALAETGRPIFDQPI